MITAEPGPIEFDDIRIGDLVKRKHRGVIARISVVTRDEAILRNAEGGELDHPEGATWELLERSAPDLPPVPTWGWMVKHDRTQKFGRWQLIVHPLTDREVVSDTTERICNWPREDLADFIPADLIPTQLVEDLRGIYLKAVQTNPSADGPLSMFVGIVGRFLDHVNQTPNEKEHSHA